VRDLGFLIREIAPRFADTHIQETKMQAQAVNAAAAVKTQEDMLMKT
jgi:hypothetical protein